MPRKQQTGWLGLDVGGANLKAADTINRALAIDFPLWKTPEKLAPAIREFLDEFGDVDRLAVTMTGELADCFATKKEGVEFICRACKKAAKGAQVAFYSVKGRFYDFAEGVKRWKELAASNWHALATKAAKDAHHSGAGLVIDIGSTTTDIVPFANKMVCCQGWNDTDRLRARELVYTGVERSPIAGITSHLPLSGEMVPVMNELFATSLDAYLLTGEIEEDENISHTADGRPATKNHAHARIARMVGGDSVSVSLRDAKKMAEYIANRQAELIAAALDKMVVYQPRELIFSGHGRFLAKRALKLTRIDGPLENRDFSADIGARCAPAIAVAELAEEYFRS